MIKNLIFSILLMLFLSISLFSCRKDEDTVQQIDQIINIYIDSLGQDMLNAKIPGSYTSVGLKDIGGLYDNVSVTTGFALKKDKDTVTYLEYIAGAKRNRTDSISPILKYYESNLVLNLTKTVNKVLKTTKDTVKIEYEWTPEVFQVSKVFYKKNLVFTKTAGQPNTIKIHK